MKNSDLHLSNSLLLSQLKQWVEASAPESRRAPRIVVVGIGNELRGDDAAGVQVARALLKIKGKKDLGELQAPDPSPFLILDAGLSPENFTGPIRGFSPDYVLLVDAAQMDQPPGTICLLDWRQTEGLSASTHTLPPFVLASYLVEMAGCRVALLGIQPACIDFSAPLSPFVSHAVNDIVEVLQRLLQ